MMMNSSREYKPFKNIRGVKYPDSVEDRMMGKGRPCASDPTVILYDKKKWILTSEAAELFDCSGSAIRIRLHKNKVPTVWVRVNNSVSLAWNRKMVNALHKKHFELRVTGGKEGYLGVRETCRILGVGRSSLYRYTEKGLLSKATYKDNGNGGKTIIVYKEEEIYSLRLTLQRIRDLEVEINNLRKKLRKHK